MNRRRLGYPTAIVWILAACLLSLPAAAADFTIVLVNDIYTMDGDKTRGGFARLAGVVKAERAVRKHVLFVHAGDSLSPSLLSDLDNGAHIVELLNMVRPDVFVPGNHEFDFGKEIFLKRMAEITFPILAANLRAPNGEPIDGIADTKLIDVAGIRVGIIGIIGESARKKTKPDGLLFRPAIKAAFDARRRLREKGVDFFVLVAHAPRRQDIALFNSGAFDVILSGYDHDLMLRYDGRTVLAESGENARYVIAVDISIDVTERNGRRRHRWHPRFRVIDTADIERDFDVGARIDAFRRRLARELDVVIGRTETRLDSRRSTIRGGEAALGNLIADAMRAAVDADIAITNGGGIRGNRIYAPQTPITRRDIVVELPFGNHTLLLEASGGIILQALENGVSRIGESSGRFPHISGLRVVVDPKKPAGNRVVSAHVAGVSLDRTRTYRLATNDFIARGGDGYRTLRKAKVIRGVKDAGLIVNQVIAFIHRQQVVRPRVDGRITILK